MKYYTNGVEILNETHIKTRRLNKDNLVFIEPRLPTNTNWYEAVREIVPQIINGKAKQEYQVYELPADSSKREALKIISDCHDTRKLSPVLVATSDGEHPYKGGLDSEGAIAKSEEFATELGAPTVEVWDADGQLHNLTIAESKSVRMAIGLQYRQHYTEQKTAQNAVKNATTTAEVRYAVDAYLALP